MTSTTVSEESLQEIATELATKVDFFRDHAHDIAEIQSFSYSTIPTYFQDDGKKDDETETASFVLCKRLVKDVTNFPFLQKKGRLQVPMALLCEAEGDPQRILVIINYWRQLKACRQRELKTSMQRFYVRPNLTNERLILVSASTNNKASIEGSKIRLEHQGRPRGRSRLSVTPWGFRCLETCTQLAETLGLVPPDEDPKLACKLLRTANLDFPRSSCKDEDCVYPSLARNHGYCCRHGLHFGPTPGKVKGRRGYLLLGDVYTRPYVISSTIDSNLSSEKDSSASTISRVKKLTTCSCRNETCVGIGYSPTMIQFDIHRFPKDLQNSIWSNSEALNMTAKTHFQISRNKSNDENDAEPSTRSSVLRLAPWHFHPRHREFLPDGSWKLLDTFRPTSSSTSGSATEVDCSVDAQMEWKGMPLPTYSPKDFLQEPIMKEYAGRKEMVASTTDMLPSWCREYAKLEEGPSSMSEIQRNFLWDHSIELEKSLASKMVSFKMKERALEQELERIRGKYNEKKFLKRRDKKRKRIINANGGKISNSNTKGTKINSTNSSGKPSPSAALQEKNTSDTRNRPKKKRSEETENAVHNNPSDYDRRNKEAAESTNKIERRDSLSGREPARRRNSHPPRMGPVHYSNHSRQQQQHHRHHAYLHSYPQQHLPHQHSNRTAQMDFRHYHHHPQPQQQHQPQQQQPAPYPQHNHQAFHHARHDERTNQYPQEQHPEVPQQQQQQHEEQQRQQQRPRGHYPEQQQNWQQQQQQGRYYN